MVEEPSEQKVHSRTHIECSQKQAEGPGRKTARSTFSLFLYYRVFEIISFLFISLPLFIRKKLNVLL
jgi:hypothetical protein